MSRSPSRAAKRTRKKRRMKVRKHNTSFTVKQGPHCTGKMAQKYSVRENTGIMEILPKTLGILFAQVVNSTILKIQDIVIFAAISFVHLRLAQEKFPGRRGNTGNFR